MVVGLLVHVPASAGYWLVFLLVAGETAGALVPGETASLPLVWACAASGAIVGDSIGYVIGARGLRLLARRLGPGLVGRGESFFARHGPKAVFLARWLPGLRLVGAWFAGAANMPWRRFLPWNALGGMAWAASVAVTAYSIGRAAGGVFAAVGAALAAATALFLGALLWRHKTRR